MDDRPAIQASKKAWIDFIGLLLRRLIDGGTPTTAKEYDQTLRVHFFGGDVARNGMKIAPKTTTASDQTKFTEHASGQRSSMRRSRHAVDHWPLSAASKWLQ
jgi:hypothetical protein